MIRSASGTYSLPSACMKSYWVSTSQKMTRAMAGNLSEDVGRCQQARRTDAQTHRREQRERTGISRCLTSVFPGASVRLAVPVLQPKHYCYLVATVLPGTARAVRPHLEREVLTFGGGEADLQKERRLASQRE